MLSNGQVPLSAQTFAAKWPKKSSGLLAHLLRTPRRESEGGNPSAVLIGWGFGEGKNRNFPSPNAFFAQLSLRKERCKQFSSKRTQQDKNLRLSQTIFIFCVEQPYPFPRKRNPLPSEVPKGAALLLCCYYIVKIWAIFNRPLHPPPHPGSEFYIALT